MNNQRGIEVYSNQFRPCIQKTIHAMHQESSPYGNRVKTSKVFFHTEVSSSVEANLAIAEAMDSSND